LLVFGGAAIGVLVTHVGGWGTEPFRGSGQFKLWVFTIAVQTTLWVVGAVVFFSPQTRKTLAGLWGQARGAVIWNVVAVGIPIYGFLIVATFDSGIPSYPFPYRHPKTFVLNSISSAVALVAVAEIVLATFALRKEAAAGTAADFDRYLELRGLLERVLAVAAAVIAVAVLAAGALRSAVNFSLGTDAYPRQDVIIVGAYFTVLLALVYLPVYQTLSEVGRKNLDAACPAEEPSSAGWSDAYDKRSSLAGLLQLDVTTGIGYKAAVAILAPITSALVTLLFPA
jgi:hypothetical protein